MKNLNIKLKANDFIIDSNDRTFIVIDKTKVLCGSKVASINILDDINIKEIIREGVKVYDS